MTGQRTHTEGGATRRHGESPLPAFLQQFVTCYWVVLPAFLWDWGAGGLNFAVVLFCFCLFYFKLCLCVELWVVRMRCFIYDAGYIGSDGPVLVSNPKKSVHVMFW